MAAQPRTTIGPNPTHEGGAPALYRVWGGAVLSDGTIVLLNAGTQGLLFFQEDGTFEKALGGEGRGPGEFINPDWLGRGSGDTLFVWDTRLQRLSTFDGAGEFAGSSSVSTLGNSPQPPSIRGRFKDGSLLVLPIAMVFVSADNSVRRNPRKYQRYDPKAETTNHLRNGFADETVFGDEGPYSLPFGKAELFAAHGGFFVFGDNGTPAIKFLDLEGRLRRVVSWTHEPTLVTEADKRNHMLSVDGSSSYNNEQRTTTLFAEKRPAFSALRSDLTGWLWVRQFAAEWEPTPSWLVFDARGVLMCQVDMPGRFSVLEIGKDYVLGRMKDEFDEESVVLYDLSRN